MNRKRMLLVTLSLVFLGYAGFSQVQQGAITPEMLQEIQSSFGNTTTNKALVNAVTNNEIKKLALNHANEGKLNDFFSHEVNTKGIANQKSSGRCWLYTGLNTLKPMVQEEYKINDFDFSHTYNFFWDQFEKANLFLEIARATAIKPMDDREVEWLFKNPVGDGGQWTTFADNVQKYGVVPTAAMPDTYQSENTAVFSSLLSRKLREFGLEMRKIAVSRMADEMKQQAKVNMLKEIYRMLVLSFGEPPVEFVWQFKNADGQVSEARTFTPKAFYNEIIGVNLSDYVMFMNDPTREYNKLYEIQYDRNLVEGGNWKYINLPNQDIKAFAKLSIMDNQAMYFSCDVGKQLNIKTGTLDLNNYAYQDLFGVDFRMGKSERIRTFDSGSTHGMSLVGVNVLPDGTVDKWKLENSWGADKGNKGYLTMTDAWFDEFMFRIIIHKKYISEEVLKVLSQEPVLLPPWDPMFMPEL